MVRMVEFLGILTLNRIKKCSLVCPQKNTADGAERVSSLDEIRAITLAVVVTV